VAFLVAVDGPALGRRFLLDAPCLVGRGPYNHVVLDDTRISRQHAKISPEAGGHVVYDLNSANGTYVNDHQVKRHRLKPDDVVRFGPFSFRFEDEDPVIKENSPARGAARFPEVMTLVGVEPAADIIDSLDAVSATNPGLSANLAELEDAERKLRTLYGFMQSISSTLDASELLDRIARNLLDIFPAAETAVIYFRDPGSGSMVPRKVLGRTDGPTAAFPMPGQFEEEVVQKGRAILSTPLVTATPRRPRRQKAPAGGLSMHAPMLFGEVAHGVLNVRANERGGTPFTQGDLDLLTGVAAQAAMALQNARLHQESLKQQRLQQDLLLAEQIQKSFLPRQLPVVEGMEFVAEYRPAYAIGGDFYDVFWLARERLGVFIGDVSGKGVSAALLMARISSDLRVAALAEGDPGAALARVNRAVLERRQPDIFVTGIYLTLDVRTREVTLANAGHLPPLVRRREKGALERIEGAAGTPIGVFEEAIYETATLVLGEGDTLVLCTDGALEATSAGSEQFGFQRLERSLAGGASAPAELVHRLLRDLRAHVGEAPQYDDLTLVACGVTDREPSNDWAADLDTESVPRLRR
jgi:serine phosphatase RsbU (regulator of sigma subunit)/pSer/pThr/pTyr-binding forkhead associated (FHA) protein